MYQTGKMYKAIVKAIIIFYNSSELYKKVQQLDCKSVQTLKLILFAWIFYYYFVLAFCVPESNASVFDLEEKKKETSAVLLRFSWYFFLCILRQVTDYLFVQV